MHKSWKMLKISIIFSSIAIIFAMEKDNTNSPYTRCNADPKSYTFEFYHYSDMPLSDGSYAPKNGTIYSTYQHVKTYENFNNSAIWYKKVSMYNENSGWSNFLEPEVIEFENLKLYEPNGKFEHVGWHPFYIDRDHVQSKYKTILSDNKEDMISNCYMLLTDTRNSLLLEPNRDKPIMSSSQNYAKINKLFSIF